jgi:hypothetical protein
MVSSVFQVFLQVFRVFLQVFHIHVLNVSFVFRRILYLLHLDVSKLDRALLLPPRLSDVSPRCQVWEGGGSPHWRRAGLTCFAGVVDEMWAGRCRTRDGRQRRWCLNGRLCPDVWMLSTLFSNIFFPLFFSFLLSMLLLRS